MIRRFTFATLAVVPALVVAPRIAHAGLEACNDIHVRADAECTLETSGGGTAPARAGALRGRLRRQAHGTM